MKIIPYENNAKIHNEQQIKNVAQSIKDFGFIQPIVVDKNGVIIIGHCRLKALELLGYNSDNIPDEYIKVVDLNETEANRLRLLDNKTNESDWDYEQLLKQVPDLDFSKYDIDWDLPDLEEEVKEDVPPEVDNENPPITKLGDIYQLGEHRLMCGDSTKKEDVCKLMNGQLADLVVTDPPYNVDYEGKTKDKLKIEHDNMKNTEFHDFLFQAFQCMQTAMKDGASFYVWHSSREQINFETSLNESGLVVREQLIWVKNSLVMGRQDYQWRHEPCFYGWKDGGTHHWYNGRAETTVLCFDRPTKSELHPTMKPLTLFDYQIKNSSKKGDIILDLFGGSGTTIMACQQNGRRSYTMEFEPKYVDVIVKRWENLTGKKAVKL